MEPEDEAFEELSRRQGDWGLQGSRKHQILRYAENVESKGTSMTDKDAMAMAVDALEYWDVHGKLHQPTEEAITALKKRLADHAMRDVQRLGQEIEQEPPQRKPLTDEQIFACENSVPDEVVSDRDWCIHFARAIEAKLKENA